MALSRLDRWLLAASAALAVAFWGSLAVHPYPGSALVKWSPIGLLTVVVWRHRRGSGNRLLGCGLLGHGLGDVLLDLDRGRLLLAAIVPFFAGHLLYLAAFLPPALGGRWTRASRTGVLAVAGLAIALLALLVPVLHGVLRYAVVAYVAALCSMAAAAIRAPFRTALVAAGALLYVGSDAWIGIDAFLTPLPWSRWLIWPAYYGAQLAITVGYLRDRPDLR